MVFHYFYINGINTPVETYDKGKLKRGNCKFERAVVMQNLLDLPPDLPLSTQPPLAPLPIKVANEVDQMEPATCNPSGKDVDHSQLFRGECKSRLPPGNSDQERAAADALCNGAAGIGTFIDSLGMSPGDLLECFRQSLNVSHCTSDAINQVCQSLQALFPFFQAPLTGLAGSLENQIRQALPADIGFTENDEVVQKVAKRIVEVFQTEGGRSYENKLINFFIVVGHSQGNFFVEGVANRLQNLEGDDGSYVFAKRLGLVSLASPTAYETLPERFRQERIAHATRRDDMIKVVATLAPNGIGKRPWPQDDSPPLWPWKTEALKKLTDPIWVGNAFTYMPNNKFVGTGSGNPEQDNALYTPLMNSHLVENYLTNPTATLPCVPLNPQFVERAELKSYCIGRSATANVFGPDGKASPASPPVANEVRSKLKEVKSRLIGDLAADLGVNPP